jgi:hypothetical protein
VRVALAVLVVAAAAAAVWLWTASDSPRVVPAREEPPPLPAPVPPARREPTTATLVIRVRTTDGRPLPKGARAGYERGGADPRLRLAGPDGTFRFSDAPVGDLKAVAEVEGYEPGTNPVVVVGGVPNEVTVEVRPAER